MATTQRVSVQDADAVFRRLQRVLEVLDTLPTQEELTTTGGAKNSNYTMGFSTELMGRTYELSSVIQFLKSNTQSSLAEIRRTLEQILETDAEAADQAKKLAHTVEGLTSSTLPLVRPQNGFVRPRPGGLDHHVGG